MEGNRICSVHGNNSQLSLLSAALYQRFTVISLSDKYLDSLSQPNQSYRCTQPPLQISSGF